MTTSTRTRILDAALACFAAVGYDRTTLADIRSRAGASTGSVYHHFGSKEQIAISLYLDALRQTQEVGVTALLRTRTGRTGVQALVDSYLGWVEANPERARFLLGMRHASFLDDGDAAIDGLNADVQRRVADWYRARIAAGELPDVDPGIRRAIIFGPCRVWAGRWLAAETTVTVAQAKRLLGAAAHAALMSLIDP